MTIISIIINGRKKIYCFDSYKVGGFSHNVSLLSALFFRAVTDGERDDCLAGGTGCGGKSWPPPPLGRFSGAGGSLS